MSRNPEENGLIELNWLNPERGQFKLAKVRKFVKRYALGQNTSSEIEKSLAECLSFLVWPDINLRTRDLGSTLNSRLASVSFGNSFSPLFKKKNKQFKIKKWNKKTEDFGKLSKFRTTPDGLLGFVFASVAQVCKLTVPPGTFRFTLWNFQTGRHNKKEKKSPNLRGVPMNLHSAQMKKQTKKPEDATQDARTSKHFTRNRIINKQINK